jgi:hypothetical protein
MSYPQSLHKIYFMQKIATTLLAALFLAGSINAQNPKVITAKPQQPITSEVKRDNIAIAEPVQQNKTVIAGTARVTSAVVYASPGYMPGCNNDRKEFTFSAAITVNGPCTVKYRWERSDAATDSYAPRTLTFTAAGTQIVTQTWSLWMPDFEGWQAIAVTAPNSIISNKAPFKIICCPSAPAASSLAPCAQALIQSFAQVSAGAGAVNCHPSANAPTVTGTMPINCYSNNEGTAGSVSYSAYYYADDMTRDYYRVIWAKNASDFRYYGACIPSPILFTLPDVQQNHVFGAKLVKVTGYQSMPAASRTYDALAGYHPANIIALENPRLEGRCGYIATNEPDNYNNLKSSKGIIVSVKFRSGEMVDCYLINNYDGAGTITWKTAVD